MAKTPQFATFEATQANPAHVKSASFAAAASKSSHTGILGGIQRPIAPPVINRMEPGRYMTPTPTSPASSGIIRGQPGVRDWTSGVPLVPPTSVGRGGVPPPPIVRKSRSVAGEIPGPFGGMRPSRRYRQP